MKALLCLLLSGSSLLAQHWISPNTRVIHTQEMKKMSVDERKDYLAKKTSEREALQKKVLALNKEREAFVASVRKESAKTDTLDTAMVKALRSQAEKKGIAWEK